MAALTVFFFNLAEFASRLPLANQLCYSTNHSHTAMDDNNTFVIFYNIDKQVGYFQLSK